MGTGNTILYWYGACGLFVLVFASVVTALMVIGRRRRGARYRARTLDPTPPEE